MALPNKSRILLVSDAFLAQFRQNVKIGWILHIDPGITEPGADRVGIV